MEQYHPWGSNHLCFEPNPVAVAGGHILAPHLSFCWAQNGAALPVKMRGQLGHLLCPVLQLQIATEVRRNILLQNPRIQISFS